MKGVISLSSAEEKFNVAYDKYADMLYRIAFIYTGSCQESEDIVQEVFIKFLNKQLSFKDSNHEKAWLIRVIANQSKDYLKSSRHSNMPLNDEIIWGKNCDDDKRLDVQAAILSLDDKYKTIIYLYYYEDCSVNEIASVLRLSKSAVKMRLSRAREQLKSVLEEYCDG